MFALNRLCQILKTRKVVKHSSYFSKRAKCFYVWIERTLFTYALLKLLASLISQVFVTQVTLTLTNAFCKSNYAFCSCGTVCVQCQNYTFKGILCKLFPFNNVSTLVEMVLHGNGKDKSWLSLYWKNITIDSDPVPPALR